MKGTQEELEAICFEMGREIQATIADKSTGKPFGFLLLMFDFGPGGFLAHISNANRSQLAKLLREYVETLESMAN